MSDENKDREYLSIRQYTERRGVSHTAVREAIKAERISVAKKEGRKFLIDVAQADIDWEKNTDEGKPKAQLPSRARLESVKVISQPTPTAEPSAKPTRLK